LTFGADTGQHHSGAQDVIPGGGVGGNPQPVESAGSEIDNQAALQTMEVVVLREVGVVSTGIRKPLHHSRQAYTGESRQRAMDRIQRHPGQLPPNLAKDLIGRRMYSGIVKNTIDRLALRRNLQAVPPTGLAEDSDLGFGTMRLQVAIIK
jgi:hypothetical protein